MSLYKHNVGWNGGDFKKQNEAKSAAMAMFDDGDFSDGENENLGVGDISLAPSKIQRVATYPTTETNIGMIFLYSKFFTFLFLISKRKLPFSFIIFTNNQRLRFKN